MALTADVSPSCSPVTGVHETDGSALDMSAALPQRTSSARAGWDHRVILLARYGTYAAGAILQERRYREGMLQFISTLLTQFRREDEEGQTLVEYGLLLALIAIIVIVALIFLGPIVSQIFQNVGTNLQGT
jgi:pilus assembly protein Flp/PilA